MELGSGDIERLYREHARHLLVYLTRRSLDAEVALDLVAETFAVAFRDRRSFRGNTHDEQAGWLWGIAKHRLSGYWKQGKVERRALTRLSVEYRPMSDAEIERVEQLSALAEIRADVAAEMRFLSEEQRDALQLRIVDELPYDIVAARLGVTEDAARARVSRGLRELANKLEKWQQSEPELAESA